MFENYKRGSHVAVCLNNYIVVFGGCHTIFKPVTPRQVWEYNYYTEQWKAYTIPKGEIAPLGLVGSCATAIGADIYVFGGLTGRGWESTNDMWKLSRSTQKRFTCRTIEFHSDEKLPSPRNHHCSWEHRACLWVFGGLAGSPTGYLDDHGEFLDSGESNQLLRFDPCNKRWTNPECFGTIPSPQR